MLCIYNLMLEKNNNLILKYDNWKQSITYWVITYILVIAVIFITIGLIFPNDFTLFGIPELGVIQYIVIIYLFVAIGFLNKNKHYCKPNILMKRKKGD